MISVALLGAAGAVVGVRASGTRGVGVGPGVDVVAGHLREVGWMVECGSVCENMILKGFERLVFRVGSGMRYEEVIGKF